MTEDERRLEPPTRTPGAGLGIDVTKPSVARVYDYYLGGKDYYPVDQAAAEEMMKAAPESVRAVRANRAFLARAVDYLARVAGVRQFIDIGSGLPTQQNVHEVAQAAAPDARVVYVDHDPVVQVHGQALLATNGNTTFIQAGLQEPEAIMDHPDTRALIDFDEPVAVLLVAILHFFSDEADPAGLVARLRDVLAPGSYLVISHIDDHPSTWAIRKAMDESGAVPWFPRTAAEITRFFDGFELVDPGLASVSTWQPGGPGSGVVPLQATALPGGEPMWCSGAVGRLAPAGPSR
ncbi:SAM-dependent methyltransferase [Actinomadura scrupuli]|uniref:SAM-dependent methyltransferase n=1 Tax=Actinomadura scrupuli TaxID=559629 RepID=UPI003D9955BA